jgi:hypothetical protein
MRIRNTGTKEEKEIGSDESKKIKYVRTEASVAFPDPSGSASFWEAGSGSESTSKWKAGSRSASKGESRIRIQIRIKVKKVENLRGSFCSIGGSKSEKSMCYDPDPVSHQFER